MAEGDTLVEVFIRNAGKKPLYIYGVRAMPHKNTWLAPEESVTLYVSPQVGLMVSLSPDEARGIPDPAAAKPQKGSIHRDECGCWSDWSDCDHPHIQYCDKHMGQFLDALDNVEPTPALVELMKRTPPWEEPDAQ